MEEHPALSETYLDGDVSYGNLIFESNSIIPNVLDVQLSGLKANGVRMWAG